MTDANSRTCSGCGHALGEHAECCPYCGRSLLGAPDAPSSEFAEDGSTPGAPRMPSPYLIRLDALDLVEAVAWEVRGQKTTPSQFLEILASRGISIESHPLFAMIMQCPRRAEAIGCGHVSHDTEEKRKRCGRSQAAKAAARSLMHHIGFLYRLNLWSDPQSLMRFAMWSCVERHGRACDACRAREGVVISVEERAVPILHPSCNCTLVQLARGQLGRSTIDKTLRQLEKRDPDRARVMRENLLKSEFASQLAMTGCGCTTTVMVVGMSVLAVVWWLLR